MDFDDLDEPIEEAPKPSSKFAPRSKFQPKKQRPTAKQTSTPKLEPVDDSHSPVAVKKEKNPDEPFVSTGDRKAAAAAAKPEEESDDFTGDAVGVKETSGHQAMEVDREEDDDEDRVVREFDVYFNRPPLDDDDETKLYVLQYPLRPSWRPYELDERCTGARLRPDSLELQMDLSVDLESENFRPEVASTMKYHKQILSSGARSRQKAGYAIGMFNGRELHLNPVHAVRQLRPRMEHLDESDSQKASSSEVKTKAESSTGRQSKTKDLQAVENKTKVQQAEEMWVPLKYHGSSSGVSHMYVKKMVAGKTSPLAFSMKPIDYLNFLCPRAAVNRTKSELSIRSLLSLPLQARLKMYLTKGPPIQKFSVLKHIAADDPIEDVFHVLQELAVLVQGYWIPKTNVQHPSRDGVFSLARDGALLLFWQNPIIKFSELENLKPKIRQLMMTKEIFPSLAVERRKCEDWKFREPVDSSFLKQYPDIVSKQNQKWQDNEMKIRAALFKEKSGPSTKSSLKPDKSGKGLDKSVPNAANVSHSRVLSDQTREALPKALKKLYQSQKIWSFQAICQGLQKLAVSMTSGAKEADAKIAKSAALAVDVPEELLEVINEVAVNIHGHFVLKSSAEHPEHNPLRNIVIDLFIGSGPNNAKLKRSEIVEAAKIKLEREPTNDEFRKVMSEFCVSKGSAWVLKTDP